MIRPFNAHVLIGNWYEDRVLEEVQKKNLSKKKILFSIKLIYQFKDVIKDFLDKKNNNVLSLQKNNSLLAANSQTVCLQKQLFWH